MASPTQGIQPQRLAVLSGLHALTGLRSNDACQTDQPPAYKPPARPRTFENMASYFASQDAVPDIRHCHEASRPFDCISEALPDDDAEEPSPISLHISTRIKVVGDSNLVVLPCTPAEQADSIARAIIEAIQGRDWTVGFPMIDENGRPRPVELEIDAGMTVEGSSNVIGTEPVINEFLRRGTQTRKRSPDRQPRNGASHSATSTTSPKRKRQTPDPDVTEQSVRKQARRED